MKLNGANNYNVLPFYSSKEYWHSKRWYTYGQVCPVAARKDYLVPFQLYFTRDVVSTSGNITLDIKRVNDDVTVKSFDLNHSFIHTPEYVIIKFPEQQIAALPLGLYYYKVTYQETNDSGVAQGQALEAYSDIISIMNDESDFVRLEYWNASDITTNGYSISFTDNFKFVSYIHSTIAKPDYEFEEELTKRLGYKFIETQVSTKVYRFNYLATEANCDAMRIARMCDYIKFTTSLDVYNALYMSFEVAWQDYGDVANLTVEFETDTIIQRLESFKRSDVANFYNALLYNINEPILFDYDTIAQYYSDFSGQGKMIRELDQITVNDITPASTMPIDLGQGAAKKIAIEEIFSKYSAFNEYFGFDEVNNAVYVKGNRSFYTMPLGDIIAGGYDESSGSGVKVEKLTDIGDVRPDSLNANDLLKYDGTNWVTIPLASISSKIDKLTDINDVVPTNLAAGDLLKYDGTNWVNIPMASISGKVEGITVNNSNYYPEPVTKLITLPNYPTTLPASDVYSWAKQPNKPSYSFSELSSHPTTLGGYGITDAYTHSDADGRFFRFFGYTTDDGDDFTWQKLGTFAYLNAFPYGVTIKRYGYGQVTSFTAGSSRFQLYSTYSSSDPNDGPNGIQFRTGWDDDKKSWRMLLDEVNYLHYTDNRYVNKAGDTMTGKLLFNADSGIDLVSIPRTKSAISFNNAGSNRIGINFTDGDGNLRIAKTDINQDWVSGDVNILLGSNNYKVWHAGNDGSGSGLDADLLDGKHLGNVGDRVMRQIGFPYYKEFGSNDTNVYLRKVLGWCYNNVNTGASDTLFVGVGHPNALGNMQIQLYCADGINSDGYPRYSSGVFFPLDAAPYLFGTNDYNYYQYALATTDSNVYSATKLQTPRTIFSKPFDGTSNVTGGAKFNGICIETDNNGNDSGRGSEINNYSAELNLQYNTSRDITMCFGGGNVRIGTGISSYKLNVNGDTCCSGKIISGNWIRSDLYSAGIDHYADDSYSAAYNACAPNNDNYCCYSIVRSGTIPLGIGFNTSSEIWLGTANTDRKAAAQWLRISGNRVTCSSDIFAYGEVAAGSASDLRLKEIQKRPSYANRLLGMGLVRDYYYNDLAKSRSIRKADDNLHTGMIYQDVLPVLSSMCGVDDDGYGKLNYIKPDFICTIAGATQDNTIELIKVNTRMSKLETAIRHLKRKINKLERKLSYEQASIQ